MSSSALQRISKHVAFVGLTLLVSGCQFQKPFGYYRVWADRHTLGAPAIFVERVRTDTTPIESAIQRAAPRFSECEPPTSRVRESDGEAHRDAPVRSAHSDSTTWLFRN